VPKKPIDINEYFGLKDMKGPEYKVIFESSPENPPEELKHIEREIDDTLSVPMPLRKKTHSFSISDLKLRPVLLRQYKRLRKYKKY